MTRTLLYGLRQAALLVAVVVSPGVVPGAVAQASDDAPDVEETSRALRFQPPAVERSSLETRWEILRLAPTGTLEEERAFLAFERTALELGFVELPAHSLVLLLEAEAARRDGDPTRAALMRDRAERLAPGSPQPAFFKARLAADRGPAQAIETSRQLLRAYQRLGGTVAGYVALESQWRRLAVLALLLFAAVFAAGAAAFAVGPASLDARLLSRRALTLGHGRALAILAVVAPTAVLWSPFAFIVAALVIAAPYLSRTGRVTALLLLGGLLAVPTFVHDYARVATAPVEQVERPLRAIDSLCDTPCVEALTSAANAGDDLSALALAWVAYRSGTPGGHETALAWLDGRSFTGATLASATALRGNVAFNRGEDEDAERLLMEAYDASTSAMQRAAIMMSLYRVHVALGARETGQQTLDAAMRTDATLVDRYLRHEARSQNLALPVVPVPASDLTATLLEGARAADAEAATAELLTPLYGRVPVSLAPIALGCAAVWLLLTGAMRARNVPSRRCARCGTPTSRFVFEEAWAKLRCVLCLQLESGAGQLSYAQRAAREARVHAWERWTGVATWLLAVAWPGAGLIAAGRTVRGILLLVPTSLAVALLVLDPTPMSIPYSLGVGTLFDGRAYVAIGLAALTVLASVVTTALARRSA